jgi:hypothetical protein
LKALRGINPGLLNDWLKVSANTKITSRLDKLTPSRTSLPRLPV